MVRPTTVSYFRYELRTIIYPSFSLRPGPISSSLFAFLLPHVPLVPYVPSDPPNAGRSAAEDANLFPSDEQLSQRTLWLSFFVVLGWSIIGLASALPLYLVSIPCIAQIASPTTFGGVHSTLEDLSLMRLLRLFDEGVVPPANLTQVRAIAIEQDPYHVRVRIIVLMAISLVFGLLPALWKILREFNTMVAYRQSFVEVRCEGQELGWLSARRAPGFVGWGEKQMKDFILRIGLGYSIDASDGRNDFRSRNGRARSRRSEEQPLNCQEEVSLGVDIQSLFTIG